MFRKKCLKFISLFTVVIITFSSFCFNVSAATVYTLSVNQPRADTYSGYIEYLLQGADGSIMPFVSFWHITGSTAADNSEVGPPTVYVTVTPTRILLEAIYGSAATGNEFYYSLNGGSVNGAGGSNYWSYGSGGSNAVSANAYIGDGTIISYKLYGNYKLLSSTVSINDYNDYGFAYSETSVLYEALLSMANSISSNNSSIIENATENAEKIQQNQDENTDKILDAGSDVEQPDFDSTNGQIDDTVGQIESIEGSYQIDQGATQEALDSGNSFLQGSDMQKASVQVKTWIDKFTSDSPVMSGFLVAAMVLGLCFWVIGRKAGSG